MKQKQNGLIFVDAKNRKKNRQIFQTKINKSALQYQLYTQSSSIPQKLD